MKIKNFLVVLLLIISGLCVNGAEISPESPEEIYDKAESYWYGEKGVYMNRSKALRLPTRDMCMRKSDWANYTKKART